MNVDRNFVGFLAGQIMGAQLASVRDVAKVGDDHLVRLADLSVRGALAVDAAIVRAEARTDHQVTAAEDDPVGKAADGDENIDIPADWNELAPNLRIDLGRRIAPGTQIETPDAADAAIRAELDRRAAGAEPVAQA